MQQDAGPMPMRNLILFVILSAAVIIGWPIVDNYFYPKPPPARIRNLLLNALTLQPPMPGVGVAGPAALVAIQSGLSVPENRLTPPPSPEGEQPQAVAKADPKPEPKAEEIRPAPELVELGGKDDRSDGYQLHVSLNPRGAAVEQVILTRFDQATVMGLPAKDANGQPERLHLLNNPEPSLTKIRFTPQEPSFLVLHYDRPEQNQPRITLARRDWDVEQLPEQELENGQKEMGVRFTTTLDDPHAIRVTKTYTVRSGEYHINLAVTVKRLDEAKVTPAFRYQLTGAIGLPVEGLWYTTLFRNALVGWTDAGGGFRRRLDDVATIQYTGGADALSRPPDGAFRYAATAVQYFASAIVVDNEQEKQDFVDRVRATAEAPSSDPTRPQLGDITVRAVSEPLTLASGQEITHKYLLYHGPTKVRLLRQLQEPDGSPAVAPELVDRYEHTLHLNTLQDYPMQNIFGTIASTIGWSWLIITTTNLMHSVLWYLHQVVPNYVVCIMLLTVMVRLVLFPLTHKQIATSMKFQEQLKRLKPEFDKLQQKYGDDFQAMNQAKTRLMIDNGINPLAPLAGCLPLLIQMPIFMGLYFALQESIFFRLEPLLNGLWWLPNLAAPDMLFYWGQWIPFISTPESLGSPLYLGPFFNILPLAAVVLMFLQQQLMMPPPTNEQEASQQSMMKIMTVMFGLFFYKVPAGLCVYFIVSSMWGLAERQFIPKPTFKDDPTPPPGKDRPGEPSPSNKPTPPTSKKGGKPRSRAERHKAREASRAEDDTLMGKLRAAWQKVLDEAKKK